LVIAFMSQELWSAVDRYIVDRLILVDPALEDALRDSEAAGLPSIHVTPAFGKLLHLLARVCAARNVLEIGTLGGYSTIWLARALPPGGRLITLEANATHADVARANIARAAVSDVVDIRLGRAQDTLPQLAAEGRDPFDLVFIDADKESSVEYFEWALRLTRPGSMILVDNVIRDGAIIDAASTDARVQGVRRFYERLAAEPRVSATAIQTVGGKGYDGFAMAIVKE
jgi:predicted O-methyltransferase YrrM